MPAKTGGDRSFWTNLKQNGSTGYATHRSIVGSDSGFSIVCSILQKPRVIILRMDQRMRMGTSTCPIQGSPLVIAAQARWSFTGLRVEKSGTTCAKAI